MAERKRAPGASGQWKKVAATPTANLLTVAIDITSGLLGPVNSAHGKLVAVGRALRLLREGATRGDIARGQFGGAFPTAILDGALAELERLRALHRRGGYAYFLYEDIVRRGLQDGPDRARASSMAASWDRHRRDAVLHASEAKRKLRSAATMARAAEDAVRVFRSLPRGSPGWTGWTSAARSLALAAGVSAALALRALRRMREAVALEFCVASRVVNS